MPKYEFILRKKDIEIELSCPDPDFISKQMKEIQDMIIPEFKSVKKVAAAAVPETTTRVQVEPELGTESLENLVNEIEQSLEEVETGIEKVEELMEDVIETEEAPIPQEPALEAIQEIIVDDDIEKMLAEVTETTQQIVETVEFEPQQEVDVVSEEDIAMMMAQATAQEPEVPEQVEVASELMTAEDQILTEQIDDLTSQFANMIEEAQHQPLQEEIIPDFLQSRPVFFEEKEEVQPEEVAIEEEEVSPEEIQAAQVIFDEAEKVQAEEVVFEEEEIIQEPDLLDSIMPKSIQSKMNLPISGKPEIPKKIDETDIVIESQKEAESKLTSFFDEFEEEEEEEPEKVAEETVQESEDLTAIFGAEEEEKQPEQELKPSFDTEMPEEMVQELADEIVKEVVEEATQKQELADELAEEIIEEVIQTEVVEEVEEEADELDDLLSAMAEEEEEAAEVVEEEIIEEPQVVVEEPKITRPKPVIPEPEPVMDIVKYINSLKLKTPVDLLLATSFFMENFESLKKFTTKDISNRTLATINKQISPAIFLSAVNKGFIEVVPDFTGTAESNEYALTQKGRTYVIEQLS